MKFRPYKKEGNSSIVGITMKVYQIDIETETIQNPIMIRVVSSDSVQTLKDLIAEYLQCDVNSIFAVLKGYRTEPTQLLDPNELMSTLPCTQKGQVWHTTAVCFNHQFTPIIFFRFLLRWAR